jgi:chemotaxis response regulator CheB
MEVLRALMTSFFIKDGSRVFRNQLSRSLELGLGWNCLGSVFDERSAQGMLPNLAVDFVLWSLAPGESPPGSPLSIPGKSCWVFLTAVDAPAPAVATGPSILVLSRPRLGEEALERPFLEALRNADGKSGAPKEGMSRQAPPTLPRTAMDLECRPKAEQLPDTGGPLQQFRSLRQAVLIGSSTGGPNALMNLLPGLRHLEVPVFIAQHMPPKFTQSLANSLAENSGRLVKEGEDGELVRPGVVYIAPGGFHMTLGRDQTKNLLISLNRERPVNGCRPSVDVLFKSAVGLYGRRAVAVMLTGMGEDGKEGVKELRLEGAFIIAQDEASSVVWGMPGSVVKAGLADVVLGLPQIAECIVREIRKGAPLP